MKRIRKVLTAAAIVFFCMALVKAAATAEEKIGVKGKIKDYSIAAKTVTITTDDGKEMIFAIENENALGKLDERLERGDEVKIKYIPRDGRNIIKNSGDLMGTKVGCS